MLVRQKSCEKGLDLLSDGVVLPYLNVVKFTTKGAEVINDLPPPFGKIFGQRRIDLGEVFVEFIQLDIYLYLDIIKDLSGVRVQMALHYSRKQFFKSLNRFTRVRSYFLRVFACFDSTKVKLWRWMIGVVGR